MNLLEHLQSYATHDAIETAHRDRVIAFLHQTPSPFHRETLEGHITGSAFIDVHWIPTKGTVPAHWHYDIRYLFQADNSAKLQKADREVISLQWVPIAQLPQINPEESFQRVAQKLMARS